MKDALLWIAGVLIVAEIIGSYYWKDLFGNGGNKVVSIVMIAAAAMCLIGYYITTKKK